MFFLCELEIRAYVTHTVILYKVKKVPVLDRPSLKTSLYILQSNPGHRAWPWECGQNFCLTYLLAGCRCARPSPDNAIWWPTDWFWFCSLSLNGSFPQEGSNYWVTATQFPLQFLFFGPNISSSFHYSSLQMFEMTSPPAWLCLEHASIYLYFSSSTL